MPDYELELLTDEQLIAYVRAGRDVGQLPAARRALQILVFGYERNVKLRLRLKGVPVEALEDLTQDAIVRAVGAAFDGTSVGQFRSWLNVIVDRTRADYFRVRARRPVEDPLPTEHASDSTSWAKEPAVESRDGEVEVQLVIDEVLETFSHAQREAIVLHVFDGLTAREVSGRMEGMSENNVAQIATRFRARLRSQLEAEGGS